MPVSATSLKVPRNLKTRIDRLARRSGESPHAFMLRALEGQVEAAERYQAFLEEGLRADEAMQRSGLGYAADDVHAYLASVIEGGKVRRPKPVRWRE
jgi:predicted transcriptional regulator